MQHHVSSDHQLGPHLFEHDQIQSHLYTLPDSINGLIAAASPLISLVNRLAPEPHQDAPLTWQAICGHEFAAFRQHCLMHRFETHVVLTTQWLLAAWIQESTQWPLHFQLETSPQVEEALQKDHSCLALLECLLDNPILCAETLTVFYVLIRLGLTVHPDKPVAEHATRQLYYCIQQQHTTHSKALRCQRQQALTNTHHQQHQQAHQHQWWFGLMCLMISCAHIVGLYQFGMQHLHHIFLHHLLY